MGAFSGTGSGGKNHLALSGSDLKAHILISQQMRTMETESQNTTEWTQNIENGVQQRWCVCIPSLTARPAQQLSESVLWCQCDVRRLQDSYFNRSSVHDLPNWQPRSNLHRVVTEITRRGLLLSSQSQLNKWAKIQTVYLGASFSLTFSDDIPTYLSNTRSGHKHQTALSLQPTVHH